MWLLEGPCGISYVYLEVSYVIGFTSYEGSNVCESLRC